MIRYLRISEIYRRCIYFSSLRANKKLESFQGEAQVGFHRVIPGTARPACFSGRKHSFVQFFSGFFTIFHDLSSKTTWICWRKRLYSCSDFRKNDAPWLSDSSQAHRLFTIVKSGVCLEGSILSSTVFHDFFTIFSAKPGKIGFCRFLSNLLFLSRNEDIKMGWHFSFQN